MVVEDPAGAARADVVLRSPGTSEVITAKALVEVAGFGLAEAKLLIDRSPAPILSALPLSAAKRKAAALRDAGAHVEIVPAFADIHPGPRLDGVYLSPVIGTIECGLLWKRKTYRRFALHLRGDGSCEEYAVDFKKRTLPSAADRVLGSILSQIEPTEVKNLGDGRIEKDGMTWEFVPSVPLPSR